MYVLMTKKNHLIGIEDILISFERYVVSESTVANIRRLFGL